MDMNICQSNWMHLSAYSTSKCKPGQSNLPSFSNYKEILKCDFNEEKKIVHVDDDWTWYDLHFTIEVFKSIVFTFLPHVARQGSLIAKSFLLPISLAIHMNEHSKLGGQAILHVPSLTAIGHGWRKKGHVVPLATFFL
jgi:hypothetical protein